MGQPQVPRGGPLREAVVPGAHGVLSTLRCSGPSSSALPALGLSVSSKTAGQLSLSPALGSNKLKALSQSATPCPPTSLQVIE